MQDIWLMEKKYTKLYDVRIRFDDDAVDSIIRQAFEQKISVDDICEKILESYQQGLKLINSKTDELVITLEGIKEPTEYLNKLIKQYFSQSDQVTNNQEA